MKSRRLFKKWNQEKNIFWQQILYSSCILCKKKAQVIGICIIVKVKIVLNYKFIYFFNIKYFFIKKLYLYLSRL
jgi:hypothetical protein